MAPLHLLPGSVEAVFFLRLPLRVRVLRLVLDSVDLDLSYQICYIFTAGSSSSPVYARTAPLQLTQGETHPVSPIVLILGFHFALRCVDCLLILSY